ncbi:MAG: LysR family transcriptional regulator [Acidiferrobacterales bacterium]|nr:LysR family transcriptional regulator [Acidiferrobacterales bacterium]
MFHQLPPLKSLRAFEAAARHGSFTKAASEISVTQGAISYQIRSLEEKLAVSLFQRKVRQVTLTAEGEQLYQITHRLFRELNEKIQQIVPANKPDVLTVSVSTFFVTRWLSRRVGTFIIQHPEITLRLQHSVSDPDFSVDAVDLAIRWGDGKWPDSQSEALFTSPMVALCSPKLLKGNQGLNTTADISSQMLLYDQTGVDRWADWLKLANVPELQGECGPIILDSNVRVQSAIDGHGLVLANRLLAEEIDLGLLVEPFPIRLNGLGYHLVWAEGALTNPASIKFRDWLILELEKETLPEI